MPSPLGLLEERELDARRRLEECREAAERARAAVAEAERAYERAVIAWEGLAAALAGARGVDGSPQSGEPAVAAAPGTVVPVWSEGVSVRVLAPDYQRIVVLLDDAAREGTGPLNCRQIAQRLGWETSAAGVEGVRAKARRMAERGWLAKEPDGRFSAVFPPGGGS
ncbi:hypothetical protein ACH4E7_23380 [Kitasatospora sp. NPDC018058]|uniref:hypothetical protein n=1 Tax=Kitasatospora sp. NPDC018058 TaxID=3364025 RepID=UPI0037BE4476